MPLQILSMGRSFQKNPVFEQNNRKVNESMLSYQSVTAKRLQVVQATYNTLDSNISNMVKLIAREG